MKNKLWFKIIHVWVVCAVLMGWVWVFSHAFELDRKYQVYLIAFVLAPFGEELLYRWLPVHLEKRFPQLGWFPGVLANFIFISIHVNNYPFAGWYWAFALQGMMGFVCLWMCRKYGYLASVAVHIKYNLAVAFVLPNL